MTTELTKTDMQAQIQHGYWALDQIRDIVKRRPDPVIINKKRYLEFVDYQLLGAFFGITAYVKETKEIIKEETISFNGEPNTRLVVIGFWARAEAWKDGKPISAAEAECMNDEPNWKNKPRFQLRSMAETRACARVLRQVLQWVTKLPPAKGQQVQEEFADVAAEEMQQDNLL